LIVKKIKIGSPLGHSKGNQGDMSENYVCCFSLRADAGISMATGHVLER
jgi:hypothetical protein